MTDDPGRRTGDEPVEIVLVADDPGDLEHVSAALDATATETTLRTYSRCEDAIEALTGGESGGTAWRPDLALVDPHLSDDDGSAFLRAVRGDPALRDLPVIVLSRSASTEDVQRYYDADANAVVRKPTDSSAFDSRFGALTRFWIERTELPPRSN